MINDPNKQGDWKIPQDEISGVSEVWANCATTSTHYKNPRVRSLQGNAFWNLTTH